MRTSLLVLFAVACSVNAVAREPDTLLTSSIGEAFGRAPAMWGPRLSPDGSRVSFIQMHPDGATFARVLDRSSGNLSVVMAGEKNEFDVSWCDWANTERLLCGLRAAVRDRRIVYSATRLAAVDWNGENQRVLVSGRIDNERAQFQDRVVDWLPDDPEHILVEEPGNLVLGVARLNIYDGDMRTTERARQQVRRYISDGYGEPRLYRRTDRFNHSWHVRREADGDWEQLFEFPIADIDRTFSPHGFGADRDELLYFDVVDGREALFGLNLRTGEERQVYAHDTVDVTGTVSLGRHRRLVAASYADDRPRLHFFDERVGEIQGLLHDTFPGKQIAILDEDWEQVHYLVSVSSDTDPGAYYILNANDMTIARLSSRYPRLEESQLAPMQSVSYSANDGTQIPAYLTRPENANDEPGGAIVLPHGGPSSRDQLGFDLLAQYFAAQGYAVLQSNYRGSSGYGAEWLGEGAFRQWRLAISDISDGVEYLISNEIADPDRICIVGWSYGGYAALMSVIERPEAWQCVVSIAGVTDPRSLGENQRNFVGGRAAQLFIGHEEDVIVNGSPVERAAELSLPLILFHAEKDINVPFSQSEDLADALDDLDADFEFIEYEHAEHDIFPERYRIDMLTRLGTFLETHLGRG